MVDGDITVLKILKFDVSSFIDSDDFASLVGDLGGELEDLHWLVLTELSSHLVNDLFNIWAIGHTGLFCDIALALQEISWDIGKFELRNNLLVDVHLQVVLGDSFDFSLGLSLVIGNINLEDDTSSLIIMVTLSWHEIADSEHWISCLKVVESANVGVCEGK